MRLKDVGGSLRRHWLTTLVIVLAIPLVVGLYLYDNRNPKRPPPRYTTSEDILIPSHAANAQQDTNSDIPPVLFQGQVELALSARTRAVALDQAKLDPSKSGNIGFSASLSDTLDTMTLSVSAPRPEIASTVLDQYVIAYRNGRRESVLDAALERQDVEVETINALTRKLTDIDGQLAAQNITAPPKVAPGAPLALPPGTTSETSLTLYQRNTILNQIEARQIDYGVQATNAVVPADFSTLIQRHTTAQIAPKPPSHVTTLLEIIGVGLLLAVGIPVLMDRFDRSITDSKSASSSLRSRVLVTIPAMPRRMRRGYAAPGSSWDSAFRSLAATSLSTDSLPKAIMVSSPTGAIHDSVAANFARALAGLGVNVALIGTIPRQGWYTSTTVVDEYGDDDYDYDEDEPEPRERIEPEPVGEADATQAAPEDGNPESAGDDTADHPLWEQPTATSVEGGPAAGIGAPADTGGYETSASSFPSVVDLLEAARNGELPADLRSMLATIDVPNLYVVPPGEDGELPLDGLPPLLDALSRQGIDTVVIGGPAFLEDPNATIIAWSTRHMLWAVEMGHVDSRDAQLAADRLDIAGVSPFGVAVVNRHI